MVFEFIGSRFRLLEMVISNSLSELKVSVETFSSPDTLRVGGGGFLFRNIPPKG